MSGDGLGVVDVSLCAGERGQNCRNWERKSRGREQGEKEVNCQGCVHFEKEQMDKKPRAPSILTPLWTYFIVAQSE